MVVVDVKTRRLLFRYEIQLFSSPSLSKWNKLIYSSRTDQQQQQQQAKKNKKGQCVRVYRGKQKHTQSGGNKSNVKRAVVKTFLLPPSKVPLEYQMYISSTLATSTIQQVVDAVGVVKEGAFSIQNIKKKTENISFYI